MPATDIVVLFLTDVSGIAYGRDIADTALMLRQAVPGKIMLSPMAAALIEPAPDTQLVQIA